MKTTLRLLSPSLAVAIKAADTAQNHAKKFSDRGGGRHNGVAYVCGESKFLAYWTPARTLTVVEQPTSATT